MKLDEMEQFVAVAELGSFTKAAEFYSVTKSSVSRRIKDLEESLQVRLFDRSTRSMKLTSQGELFYRRVKKILNELELVKSELVDEQLNASGAITVYAPSVMTYAFTNWICQFKEKHPNITLHLFSLDSNGEPKEGSYYDLLIQAGSPNNPNLIARKLADVQAQYYASPEYIARRGIPRDLNDLRNHETIQLVVRNTDDKHWTHEEDGETKTLPIESSVYTDSVYTALALGLKGLGVFRLPNVVAEDYVQQGKLIKVFPDHHIVKVPVYALYPSSRHMSKRVRLLLTFLTENLQNAVDVLQKS